MPRPFTADEIAEYLTDQVRRVEHVKVRAAELRPGDLLLGSRQTVISGPQRNGDRATLIVKRAPTRKYPDPQPRLVSWNARTTMTVERELP